MRRALLLLLLAAHARAEDDIFWRAARDALGARPTATVARSPRGNARVFETGFETPSSSDGV